MDVNNQKLREGIISKLKAYDAYIDNELPDYILVMIANKKTMLQIQNDLQLFLGENTEAFTEWLQSVLSNPDNLEAGQDQQDPGSEEDSSPKVVTLSGGEGKRSDQESHDTSGLSHDKEQGRVSRDGHRSRGGLNRKTASVKPDSTRSQDLRSFIKRRQRGSHDKRGDQSDGSSGDEREAVSTSLSSVVNVPKRPKVSNKGGSRILQKALLGLGGKKPSKRRSLEGDPPTESPDKVGGVKRVLRVKREDLDKILVTKPAPKKTKVPQVTSTKVESTEHAQESDSDPADDQVVIELDDDEEQELDDETIIERATLAAVKSVLPVAARLGRKRSRTEPQDLREIITSKHSRSDRTNPRFVVTLDGADESFSANQTSTFSDNTGSMPERCKFWPNCKNGDTCIYAHPTIPCKLFPNCKFGQKCLFVHPQCKFDSRCTRPDCPYLHTAPRHLMKQAMMPMPVPMFKQSRFIGGPTGKFPDKSALKWTPKSNASDQTTAQKS